MIGRPTTAELLACCGSRRWAERVAAAAPYRSVDAITATGERVWWGLDPDDWREALAAHPRIGDPVAAGSREGSEQAAARDADADVLAALARGNRDYEQRFGTTYVVRATGRDAEEMLEILLRRLGNDPAAELREAAGQQWEITALRLAARWQAAA